MMSESQVNELFNDYVHKARQTLDVMSANLAEHSGDWSQEDEEKYQEMIERVAGYHGAAKALQAVLEG